VVKTQNVFITFCHLGIVALHCQYSQFAYLNLCSVRLENQLPSVWLGYMPFFIHEQCCPAGFGLLVNVPALCFMLMGDSSISGGE
jgi:hypothetical protein